MDANHQHLFVIRPIEYPNVAALGQAARGSPKKIVLKLLLGWRLERINLAALGIHPRHHMLDGSIFSGRIHGLEDQQHRPAILGIELVLQLCQAKIALSQRLFCMLFGVPMSRLCWIEVFQSKIFPAGDAVGLRELPRLHLHLLPVLLISNLRVYTVVRAPLGTYWDSAFQCAILPLGHFQWPNTSVRAAYLWQDQGQDQDEDTLRLAPSFTLHSTHHHCRSCNTTSS